MSWVGLADPTGAEFDLAGLSSRTRSPARALLDRPGALACRGTLLIEADIAQFTVPRPLVDHGLGASFGLRIEIGEEDAMAFTLSIGGQEWAHSLPLCITDELQSVKVSYAWDTATRAAVLSVYQPRSQHLAQVLLASPRPIPWPALRSLIHEAPSLCRRNQMTFVALSREFEPAGPMPGLLRNTPILTPFGPRPISELRAGDHVTTHGGGDVPIQATIRRTLPARGGFAPRHLQAPYLGLETDIVLSAESLIEFEGSDVEYLLGTDRVLAFAAQVGEPHLGLRRTQQQTVTYHQLVLDRVEVLESGIGVASMNLGAPRPSRIEAATTLWADVPARLTLDHGEWPLTIGRPYEIVTLASSRAA